MRFESLEPRVLLSGVTGGTGSEAELSEIIRGELRPGVAFEAGTLLVTSNGSGTHVTSPGVAVDLAGTPAPLDVDGVADLIISRSDGTFRCTGSLLPSGQHAVTAAHCLTDGNGNLITSQVDATWELSAGDVTVTGTTFHVHPGYNGDFFEVGNDLAIVEFASAIDSAVPRYDLYTTADEIDRISVKVGYGQSGHGNDGATSASGTKRAVLNEWDSDATTFGANNGEHQLGYDFDSGSSSNDGYAYHFGFPSDLGYGDDEGGAAPGDSGGPTFLYDGVDWLIAGITSYGVRFGFGPFTSDVNKNLDSSWGEFGGDTRITSFLDWINSIVVSEPDTTAPLISGVAASNITDTSADITWTTDEPADSVVNYSTDQVTWSTVSASDLVTNHLVGLSGLSAETTYYYYVESTDGSGNTATDDNGGAFYSFTTSTADTTAPVISGVAAINVTDTSADITWDTDEASDSVVNYSTDQVSWSTASVADLVTSHLVGLSGLNAETTYYYYVESTDSSGNTATDDNGGSFYSFTTLAAVAGLDVSGIDPASMPAGTTVDVTISGTGFASGAVVTFENGDGPAPTATVTGVSSTQITATVTAKSGGPPRNRVWDVCVTNPDSAQDCLVDGFTVTVGASSGSDTLAVMHQLVTGVQPWTTPSRGDLIPMASDAAGVTPVARVPVDNSGGDSQSEQVLSAVQSKALRDDFVDSAIEELAEDSPMPDAAEDLLSAIVRADGEDGEQDQLTGRIEHLLAVVEGAIPSRLTQP